MSNTQHNIHCVVSLTELQPNRIFRPSPANQVYYIIEYSLDVRLVNIFTIKIFKTPSPAFDKQVI